MAFAHESALVGFVVEGVPLQMRPVFFDLLGNGAGILAEFQCDCTKAASAIETGFDEHSVFKCKMFLFSFVVVHCGSSFLPQIQCCYNDNTCVSIAED